MDDYDLRRLWSFKNRTLRLSQAELVALRAVDPQIAPEELDRLVDHDARERPTGYVLNEGGL